MLTKKRTLEITKQALDQYVVHNDSLLIMPTVEILELHVGIYNLIDKAAYLEIVQCENDKLKNDYAEAIEALSGLVEAINLFMTGKGSPQKERSKLSKARAVIEKSKG